MAVATLCKPITILGGANPQSMGISAVFGSSFTATNSVTGYYTVNGGAPQSTSTVSPYSATATGLTTGDVVRFCVDADVDVNVGDTGVVSISGDFTQIDADGCEKDYAFSENCQPTVIDPSTQTPDCSSLPSSIDCANLPYTVSVPNATSVMVTFSGTDYSFSSGDIVANTAGVGGAETATVTASNGNAAQDCVETIDIAACGSGQSGPDCGINIDIEEPENPGEQNTSNVFQAFTGVTSGSMVATGLPAGVTLNDLGGGYYSLTATYPASTANQQIFTLTWVDPPNEDILCENTAVNVSV